MKKPRYRNILRESFIREVAEHENQQNQALSASIKPYIDNLRGYFFIPANYRRRRSELSEAINQQRQHLTYAPVLGATGLTVPPASHPIMSNKNFYFIPRWLDKLYPARSQTLVRENKQQQSAWFNADRTPEVQRLLRASDLDILNWDMLERGMAGIRTKEGQFSTWVLNRFNEKNAASCQTLIETISLSDNQQSIAEDELKMALTYQLVQVVSNIFALGEAKQAYLGTRDTEKTDLSGHSRQISIFNMNSSQHHLTGSSARVFDSETDNLRIINIYNVLLALPEMLDTFIRLLTAKGDADSLALRQNILHFKINLLLMKSIIEVSFHEELELSFPRAAYQDPSPQ